MITNFEFDGIEAAYYIGGVSSAVKRRVPDRGHTECIVKPLSVNGKIMKRRMPCKIRIYAEYNGHSPYAWVIGNSATARDLYRALDSDGFTCDLIC